MENEKAFEMAEFAAMTEKQQVAYQESLIHYSDMKNIIDTAVEDMRIGIAENLIKLGLSDKDIAGATSLTAQEVQEIRLKINKK